MSLLLEELGYLRKKVISARQDLGSFDVDGIDSDIYYLKIDFPNVFDKAHTIAEKAIDLADDLDSTLQELEIELDQRLETEEDRVA